MALGTYVFFNESSTTSLSNVYSIPPHCESLLLSVSDLNVNSDIDLEVEIRSDNVGDSTWHKIGAISRNDFKIGQKITDVGFYDLAMLGAIEVRVINNATVVNNVKVYGVFN